MKRRKRGYYCTGKNIGNFLAHKRNKHESSNLNVMPEMGLKKENPMDKLLKKMDLIKKQFKDKLLLELCNTDCSNLVNYLSDEFNKGIDSLISDENFPSFNS